MALHRTVTYYGEEDHHVDLPAVWYHYLVIASALPACLAEGFSQDCVITHPEKRAWCTAPNALYRFVKSRAGEVAEWLKAAVC